MDIHIRNIEPMAVKKLDELAKKKGLNRSEYIREMILDLSVLEMKDNTLDRLEKQLEVNNVWMKQNTNTLDELVHILKELIVDE